MAYAMGRTPAKPHQEQSDREVPLLAEIEEPVDVKRMTGEWEKGPRPVTYTKTTSPPPLKTKTRLKATPPKPSQTRPTSAVGRTKTKESQQLSSEPKTSASRRPSVEAGTSPVETGEKYLNRLTEAKAMMCKVRIQLSGSRNTSRAIVKEVLDATERLFQLVREAEADPKKAAPNGEDKIRGDTREERISNATEGAERDDRIIRAIKENNRLLLENEKRMSEVKQLIEDQPGKLEKFTYANAVMEGAKPETKYKPRERKTLHSIAVTSQDDQETGEEVLERVRKAVEAKEGWTRVEKVRKAKDRKIIMGCNTREEREEIRNKIEKAGQRLVVEDMKNKDPLLVLKSVLTIHTDEEVVRALKNQNREVFHGLDDEESRIVVKYRKRTRNPHTNHVVVTVSPKIWARATEQGRLKVDLQNVFVEDQSPLVQCSKCLGYGHGRRFCKAPVEACSHCGGPHLRPDCPGKVLGETPECVNCKRADREETGHNAFSRDCSVRRKWDDIARASIQYC